jgi:hypothetical protein
MVQIGAVIQMRMHDQLGPPIVFRYAEFELVFYLLEVIQEGSKNITALRVVFIA